MPPSTPPQRSTRRFAQWAVACAFAWCCLVGGAAAQALSLRYHAQSDGLSNLVITALVQSQDGRLWIGTENGLYRHDGARIERVDTAEAAMPSRQINALAGDGRGGLWIGTADGVFHWGGSRLEAVDSAGQTIVVRQGQTITATADGGALVAAEGRLHTLRHDAASSTWRASPAFPEAALRGEPMLSSINAVMEDTDGAWWLGCGTALCRWQAGELQRWGEREGFRKARWAGLLRARDGSLWVRSQTQVLRSPKGASTFEDVTPADLNSGSVHLQQPLVEDGDGRVMTQSDTGLLRWQAGQWTHFAAAHGLSVGGGVHAILVDRHHDVWLGTAGHGLAHWRGYRHWRHWTRREGLPSDDVWSFVEETPGRMWLGTGRGAVVLQRGAEGAGVRPVPQGGPQDEVGALARDASGQMWVATYSGELFRRSAGALWQRVATGLPLVMTLTPAADGGVWLGADKGLYLVKPVRGSALHEVAPPPGMDPKQAKSMTVYNACTLRNGPTWFGTSAGLLMHDAARGVTQQPAVKGLPPGLAFEKLSCGGDGALWAAVKDHRVWRVTHAAGGWQAEMLHPGLLGQRSMMALLADSRGWLWMTTDDGVLVWNGRQWRRFDESNGLVWSDSNQNALYEDAAGSVWIGTSHGVSQVQRPELLFEPVPVELHITRVRRDLRAWPHDRPWAAEWSAGALQIAWTVPTFANRSAQQVRYRLKGLSGQWSTTQHDDVSFAALPAGRYTFEAVAENVDLGQASEVVSLQFEILPPWWQSAWARAAYVVAAAAFMALLYRWRVRLLVRRQRELEALVGQRTAELEASYEQMRTLALTDGLTGAMNRRAIMELASRELAHARRGEAPVAFVMLDADHFKSINDTHGHLAGDAVLKQLVQRLRGVMRSYDAIGRWGGEEFLLVLPGLSLEQEEGRRRVERLQRCVAEEPFDIGADERLAVTCSAGAVGALAGVGETIEVLIGQADAALYAAKHGGRDRVVFV